MQPANSPDETSKLITLNLGHARMRALSLDMGEEMRLTRFPIGGVQNVFGNGMIGDLGGLPSKRGKGTTDGKVKRYANGYVYIVDAPRASTYTHHPNKKARVTDHKYNCTVVEDFFRDYTPYQVISVTDKLPSDATKKDWRQFWKDETRSKTEDDLLIIYFHGHADDGDMAWNWKLEHTFSRSQRINAFELVRLVGQGLADVTFLLDCFIQTRPSDQVRKAWERTTGMTEIIARPEVMMGSVREKKEGVTTFTEGVFESLTGEIDKLRAEKDLLLDVTEGSANKKTKIKSQKKRTVFHSIPELMRSNGSIYSNPIRIWLDRPKSGDIKTIRRIKVDMCSTFETGQLEFVGYLIQGQRKTPLASAKPHSVPEMRPSRAGHDSLFMSTGKPDDDDDDDDTDYSGYETGEDSD